MGSRHLLHLKPGSPAPTAGRPGDTGIQRRVEGGRSKYNKWLGQTRGAFSNAAMSLSSLGLLYSPKGQHMAGCPPSCDEVSQTPAGRPDFPVGAAKLRRSIAHVHVSKIVPTACNIVSTLASTDADASSGGAEHTTSRCCATRSGRRTAALQTQDSAT